MTKKISQTILSVGLAVVILSTALFCAAYATWRTWTPPTA